jgi:hypothetical protein
MFLVQMSSGISLFIIRKKNTFLLPYLFRYLIRMVAIRANEEKIEKIEKKAKKENEEEERELLVTRRAN